jgi:putative CocE/NonD family hydrolase
MATSVEGAGTGMLGGVRVQRDVEARMRDGVTLRADVYRPDRAGDLPVLLMRNPYDKAVAQALVYQHPAWYARQGYVVVVQDVRGRYASDGDFDPLRREAEDGEDTVVWASRLPGTTGRVGMYGFSYNGATQLLAATRRPAGLACLAPGFTGSDYYDGWTYRGGALHHAFIVSWVMQFLAVPDAVKQGKLEVAARLAAQAGDFPALYASQPLDAFPPLAGTGVADYFFTWLRHDTRDAYWREISLRERYDAIQVPCLHLGGWFDTFIEGTLENYAALRRRAGADRARAQRLVVGPWVHIPWGRLAGARNFGEHADSMLDELQVRWFHHWLKGEDTGLLDEPPVRLFVMGENRWREADDWPPPEARVEEWHLRSSGRANSLSGDGELSPAPPEGGEPPDLFVYLPGAPVPSLGGTSCCLPDTAPMGAFDQTAVEVRNDVLVYTSPPLERAVEVTGPVELVLHAATSAVDTDWVAKLVHVDGEGRAVNLCDGIVRARFRDSLEHPTLLEPDRVYEYRLRVGSTSNLFERGDRIRLEVSSSSFPLHDANPNTGERVGEATALRARPATQAVFHDPARPSRLRLPIVQR